MKLPIIDLNKCLVVQYRVTGAFGANECGDIVDAILIQKDPDNGQGLLYFPQTDEYTCASYGMCRELEPGLWIDLEPHTYVNVA